MKRLLPLLLILGLLSGCGFHSLPPETTASPTIPEPASSEAPTAPPPDLLDCQAYANVLTETHGVTILIGTSVQEVTPWDYDLQTEEDPVVLYEELGKLDRALQNYPEDMLRTVSQSVGGLRLSLVRGIYGKEGKGGLQAAAGLQYQEQDHVYIALTCGLPTPHTLYHELFHILDNYILEHTGTYARWNDLNPPGFQYDYDYAENQLRDGSRYLQYEDRAFIDTYAMSFPEEDRARIMEYAMTPGNDWLFASHTMQLKLAILSLGIREAFGLTEDQEPLIWEQYLRNI